MRLMCYGEIKGDIMEQYREIMAVLEQKAHCKSTLGVDERFIYHTLAIIGFIF